MSRENAMKTKLALALLILSTVGPVASVTAAEHARIFLNGAFDVGSKDFSQTRTFKEFAEDGTIESQYSVGSGVGFELGFHWRFKGRFGAMASVSSAGRDATVDVTASIPHPLYLEKPRSASTSQEGLSYHETIVHVDFVYAIPSGKSLEILLFAGPSFADVKADVVTKLNYSQKYPYDEVTVTSLSSSRLSDSGVGFNIGAGLDYRLGKSRRFGLGAQARFTTGSANLVPAEGPTIDIDAGGFQAAAGVRIFF
ncbi:MAG TPA: outer membrane beta-barrel protein [Vicinamibacteria bacterium]|nr:outer membrane beta-barrel protein [Vicinamibacteria bacterium]